MSAFDRWVSDTYYREKVPIPWPSWKAIADKVMRVSLEAERRALIGDAETEVKEALDFVDLMHESDIEDAWLRALDLEDFAKEYEEELERMTGPKTYDKQALESLEQEVREYGGVVMSEYDYNRLKNVETRYTRIRNTLKAMEERLEALSREKELRLKAEEESQRLKRELERAKLPDEIADTIIGYLETVVRTGRVV